MKINTLLLVSAFACGCSAAIAQTAPVAAGTYAPATMASPNTTRSSMPEAAAGTGTVVTDRTPSDGHKKNKAAKAKTDGSGKMKAKM